MKKGKQINYNGRVITPITYEDGSKIYDIGFDGLNSLEEAKRSIDWIDNPQLNQERSPYFND